MPSKKLTAKKRDEIKRKRTKQSNNSIIIPAIILIMIIVIIVAIGLYFLPEEDEKKQNINPKINQEPIAIKDSFTVLWNTSQIELDVLHNDNYSDENLINITNVTYTNGLENGEVLIFGNKLYFTPNPGFKGSFSFNYEIDDGEDHSATTSVDIFVTPDNKPVARIDTSKGVIRIKLFTDKVPNTCNNFINLAQDGFYDGMIFHRISNDFMIQAGYMYPDGSTVESPYGNIDFEYNEDALHVDGAISMASTGPGVGGSSQFFICDGAQSFLDGNYAVFGLTSDGIDVVRDIANDKHDNSSSAGGGKPLTNILINKISIEYPLS
jgi:peptidyl-prolyl cis-trans isomerase B (cyclophilin B)